MHTFSFSAFQVHDCVTKASNFIFVKTWAMFFKALHIFSINIISVISERLLDGNERLCAMEPRLHLERFLPQAGLEPKTTRSVGQHLNY